MGRSRSRWPRWRPPRDDGGARRWGADGGGGSRMSSSVRQTAESPEVTYVDSAARLRTVCEHLAGVDRFALDTEFVGERTYVPALELIQVATPSQMALIDCRAVLA